MKDYSIERIIDVETPLLYGCRVWGYIPGHSQLLIRVYKDDFLEGEAFYLVFETVLYFEGAMSWKGIDFQLGLPDECKMLLQKENIHIPEGKTDIFLQYHHLFVINRPECQIRIFAGAVHRVTEMPDIFGGSPKV